MQCLDVPSPLVVLIGPTAVGKSEIAIQLAERLDGEIVSADSRLFYRGMDIGTAKPTPQQRARVPHHLIDVAEPDEVWSLALFQRAAQQAIATIHARERLPLLVGGTGQYVRAVIEGWELPEQKPSPALRHVLEDWAADIGPFELHRRLARLDEPAAAGIQPQNVRRTIRALEVILMTGRRFSEQRRRRLSPYHLKIIGLKRPRAELYARIDQRVDAMLAAGLLDEVRRLLERGYSPQLPTLSAIGYAEMAAVLQGKMTLEEAAAQMKRATRQFVRRQANWFKESDARIRWFEVTPWIVSELENWICSQEGWVRSFS